VVGLLAVIAVVASALLASVNQERSLGPLPPGPPKNQAVEATIQGVSLDDMKRRSHAVFVGTALAVGGSEGIGVAGPPESGGELTVHRVRFSVERALRGNRVQELDLIVPDISELDTFEIGTRYLIFAENRSFGDGQIAGLSPTGYYQGTFRAIGDAARSDRTGVSLSIEQLASELGRR